MATKNPRINVTFEEATSAILLHIAGQAHKSISSVVRELVLESIERREDFYLAELAKKLDKVDTEAKMYNHKDAWK